MGSVLGWRKVEERGRVGRGEGKVWGSGKMWGRCEKGCWGVGEGVGNLLRCGEKWWDDEKKVRKDVGVGEKCGKR